jgi:aminoglycoside 6-adenylyltransferase
MRSEREMLELTVETAQEDDRIRAVIMNGSRASPSATPDPFQDFDVVYFVTDVAPFRHNTDWIERFGEIMIMQMPEDIQDPPSIEDGSFTYLMQFTDGNRIDLSLVPVDRLDKQKMDSQSLLLLDKDGVVGPLDPPSDRDYLPTPPTTKAFADCCNEFWWVAPYVAKGLWREEILYAKYFLDRIVRDQLMKMIDWYVGMRTDFTCSPGKAGKYLDQYLEPALWDMLKRTYSDAGYERTWDALETMCNLFRTVAIEVAEQFEFDYPCGDDERVRAYLEHVRHLPRDARKIY